MALIKLISFPQPSDHKVKGIKALRNAFGIGLKEAKDLIEELQDGRSRSLETVAGGESIMDFASAGGTYGDVGEVLRDQLTTCATDAVKGQQYELAKDIIILLQRYAI